MGDAVRRSAVDRRDSCVAPSEIVYRKADGANITLPSLETEEERAAFRPWLAEQGAGEIVGPQVRAAGRIVLSRDKGKLLFIDIRDMTGQMQLFIGRDQVGESWELAQCFDLGDIIGVDGDAPAHEDGRTVDLRRPAALS